MNEITWRAAKGPSLATNRKFPAFSKHTKWLLTAAVVVVPLKAMGKWRSNKTPILQMAIERIYFITIHHQAGLLSRFVPVGPGQTGTCVRSRKNIFRAASGPAPIQLTSKRCECIMLTIYRCGLFSHGTKRNEMFSSSEAHSLKLQVCLGQLQLRQSVCCLSLVNNSTGFCKTRALTLRHWADTGDQTRAWLVRKKLLRQCARAWY